MNRLKSILSLVLAIFLLSSGLNLLSAQPKTQVQEKLQLQQSLLSKPFLAPQLALIISAPNDPKPASPKPTAGLKSPVIGFLFSLTVPGSGEIYAKSWLKGLAFLGVETGLWVIYGVHQHKGKDLEKDYMAYADKYWSETTWEQWWNSLSDEDRQVYSHHELPETKTQQYYEMIGKYQKYNAGWDDVHWISGVVTTDTSKKSLYYMALRGRSNDELKLATTATAIVIANHVFSAIDAIWTVKRFNKAIKPSVKVNYVMINNKPQLVANLTLSW